MSSHGCSCHCHDDHHHSNHTDGHHHHSLDKQTLLSIIFSFTLLVLGLITDYFIKPTYFTGYFRFFYYLVAYLPVAIPVIEEGFHELKEGSFFNEFTLMVIATLGAFSIKEYSEGVGVMLFYTLGELFQGMAVQKAKKNIRNLLRVHIDKATVLRNNQWISVNPKEVKVGEIIQVKAGEKIPLDGILLSDVTRLNTAAITGESKPITVRKGEKVLSATINQDYVIEIKTTTVYENSSFSRILKIVESATQRKAKTELLIRRLAKVYTPIVFGLALAICILPWLFVSDYVFTEWLYRALVFLVISCPCALVISIPLGYFGGLGAASRKGILFKGASFLEQLTKIDTLVMDKTGTLTYGVFKVNETHIYSDFQEEEVWSFLKAIEANSTHPIAKAIINFNPIQNLLKAESVKELPGKGLTGIVNGTLVYAGNQSLMHHFNISTPNEINSIVDSVVFVAIDKKLAGYITISDEVKPDAKESLCRLKKAGIRNFIMLSGDKKSITDKVARELGIEKSIGGLLPEDKFNEVEKLQKQTQNKVAFMGDGINDAPVLAIANVGIAMGKIGSDIAIETADVVIQTDEPSKLVTAMAISKATKQIVFQNITLALGVKIIILILGALGYANLWSAVFADVGVALLAIFNAMRLQRMNFK